MAFSDEYGIEETDREPMTRAQRAWCVLMLLVMLASAAALGLFLNDKMNPEGAPIVRLALADLAPEPGFDL